MPSDNVITPMLVLGGVSYANNWYNTGDYADINPLLYAGVAAIFLEAFAQLPGMAPVASAIGWVAVVGMILSPVQKPSPIENLLSIGQKTTKKGIS